ncbi:unnamed protein product, partial [Rotaria magnacalcarata]
AVRVRRKGIDGKLGSSGGDTGDSGVVKLVGLDEILQQIQHINVEITSENPIGQRGKPGEAGKHGRDGRAYVVVGEWKRFKRKIKTKGGRLHETKFFEKYCNPKNEVSYQDWLASSLNHVLEKMTELEGLPADKIKTQPDIEHDLQQILILKEEFSQTVHAEKQRLQAEKLDTNELSLKHHQSIYQQLQDEIQRVDVNHLATGLDIRSTEIVNLRNTISRIVNEQRFSQRLAAVQR